MNHHADQPLSPQRTALYRFFDASGRLLYIGISLQQVARQRQHRASSEWYQDIARSTVEWHPSRSSAADAERLASQAERPGWNRAFNRKRTATEADAIRRRWWNRGITRRRRAEEAAAAEAARRQAQRVAERARSESAPCSHAAGVVCRKCTDPRAWEAIEALLQLKERRIDAIATQRYGEHPSVAQRALVKGEVDAAIRAQRLRTSVSA